MEEQEECLIDPQLVNNMNLARVRQSRQLEDQDYHLGTGAIFDDDFEELPDYDYSHLMAQLHSNEEDQIENVLDQTSSFDIHSQTSNPDGLPEAEKVVHEMPSAPTYSGDVFGRVKFLCRLSLAVNESALVHIPSRLQRSTISSKYKEVH